MIRANVPQGHEWKSLMRIKNFYLIEILNINIKLLIIIIIINRPEKAENADNTPYVKQGGKVRSFDVFCYFWALNNDR